MDICDVYDLHILVTGPSRITASKETLLDVILSNAPLLALKSGTVDIGLSDHMLTYTIFNNKLLKPKARLIKGKCFLKKKLLMGNLTKICSSFLFMRFTY